jgi:hypothetical protein
MTFVDDRPLTNKDFYTRLALLFDSETLKQASIGMQRICEYDLTLQVIASAHPAAYIEIGSGSGYFLRKVKRAYPALRVVGFELDPPNLDFVADGIELHTGNIFVGGPWDGNGFTDFFHSVVKEVIASADGPVVIYTDNGNKPAELEAVSRHMRVGDICGSHDFIGPSGCYDVLGQGRPNNLVFLGDRNFDVMAQYEDYILKHMCLQRFWQKGTDFAGNPSRHVV